MTITTTDFRWRNDDGTQIAATWKAAAGTPITLSESQLNVPIRLRVGVGTDATTLVSGTTVQLYYSVNGGAYTILDATSTHCQSVASGTVANGTVTTQLLTTGTFFEGEVDTNNGLGNTYGAGGNAPAGTVSEVEFCFKLQSAFLSPRDTLDFHIDRSAPSVTNAVTPHITISTVGADVGATLSTVAFPLRHAGMGPFKSSAGNIYFFGRDTTNTGTIEPHKASDPLSSFTAQTAKTMSSGTTTAIEAGACYQVADVIHIATQISTGATYYNSYNMSTDAWTLTTSETAVAAAAQTPSTGATFVSLVVRSGGEVVICYCAGQTAMSSGFNMIRGTRRTGTNTYSALSANIDNGGSVNWTGPVAVLGASDRVHFFFKDNSNFDLFQRTLTAANALQTFPSTYEGAPGSNNCNFGPGVSYVSGGTTKIAVPQYGGTGTATRTFVATLDSSDTPTAVDAVVGDNNAKLNNNTAATTGVIHALAVNGTDLHLLYGASTDNDLYHDVNTGAGWGTDTNELAATLNYLSTNVYDRSGTKLAMVVDDGGAIKYAEITLATPSLLYPTNDVLTQLRRR